MSNAEEAISGPPHHIPLPHRSSSVTKPKGILKNAPVNPSPGPATPGTGQHLQWDEQNIALTEIQKDSLMKITEPKTPYVRYNAETDEIDGEIPELHLGGHASSSSSYAASPTQANFSSRGDTPDPSEQGSRRTSFSSTGKPSVSGRSGSGSSSRSTSFSLPTEAIGKEMRSISAERGEVEEEEEMDEEAQKKHEEFLKARGRHYSNEAEAMKRAQRLMAEEEEEDGAAKDEDASMEEDASADDDNPPALPVSRVNGVI